jgi:hypothetical protein
MKKIMLMLALVVGIFFIAGASDAAAQGKGRGMGRGGNKSHTIWNSHKKDTHGYKNYGQYRRTQVGNRRFRTVNRYSWIDGIRRKRAIRVYY